MCLWKRRGQLAGKLIFSKKWFVLYNKVVSQYDIFFCELGFRFVYLFTDWLFSDSISLFDIVFFHIPCIGSPN